MLADTASNTKQLTSHSHNGGHWEAELFVVVVVVVVVVAVVVVVEAWRITNL